ncbi:MAG TPA: protein-glutamate O-methyltransferase CheR, partial [Marinagarivorans sp.]
MGVADQKTMASGSDYREFTMSYENFADIRDVAYRITGITLSDHKQNMIYGRLARRLRALNLTSFDDYCNLLSEDTPEINEFINAITTNLTAFFRENHHFDFLKNTAFPRILHNNAGSKRLRIWSAGCSTGEEPYSIAMTLAASPGFAHWDAKILATDLDSNVVAKGRAGIYQEDRCTGIPDEYTRYLKRNPSTGEIKVRESVQQKIAFK